MGLAAPVFSGDEERERRSPRPAQAEPRRLSSVGREPPGGAAQGTLTVLVVEDNLAMRLLVTYNLEAAGFRVVVAATGREGLELAAREEPDVVLLDLMLPDVGGFEVAEQLRNVPVVFMSARA